MKNKQKQEHPTGSSKQQNQQPNNASSDLVDALDVQAHNPDTLLGDIFHVLWKSGHGEHSPMHTELHQGNSLSISFGYQGTRTTEANYKEVIALLKEEVGLEVADEQDDSVMFVVTWQEKIRIFRRNTNILFSWSFSEKQIKNCKNEYHWFDTSRTEYENKEYDNQQIRDQESLDELMNEEE